MLSQKILVDSGWLRVDCFYIRLIKSPEASQRNSHGGKSICSYQPQPGGKRQKESNKKRYTHYQLWNQERKKERKKERSFQQTRKKTLLSKKESLVHWFSWVLATQEKRRKPPRVFFISASSFFCLHCTRGFWVTRQWLYGSDNYAVFFSPHLRPSGINFILPGRPSSALRHWDVVEYSQVADSIHAKTWSNKKTAHMDSRGARRRRALAPRAHWIRPEFHG